MIPTNHELLDAIVDCIQCGHYIKAFHLWSSYNQVENDICDNCHYIEMRGFEDCSMCLETNLRTISLYEDDGDSFGHSLSVALDKLAHHNKRNPMQ